MADTLHFMLKIRPEQMHVFLAEARRRLSAEVAERLALELPAAVLKTHEGRLASRAAAGVRKAESFGLTSGESIYTFVAMMFLAAPDFFQYPPIADKLRQPSMNAQQRFDYMLATTSKSQWEGVALRARLEDWDQI